jgi:hypothetical protein
MILLRIGGPQILNAFNRLNRLPSPSSIYKYLADHKVEIDISLDSDLSDLISNNMIL